MSAEAAVPTSVVREQPVRVICGRTGRFQPKRSVWTMLVVVPDVDP
jgi:hypothetical protein